ncbi:hypothetical protein BC349_11435 [Flavihumibacter stibioxidans]|uniref:AB hydrolase-1 domain-containing protein n=2 Tax=Flavihumibacter stibioxidans TaxID=1834163 RepID=A0ABR7MAX8_9BACT|nr:hypothetical protein [Flavihumibacter stibioxidans]
MIVQFKVFMKKSVIAILLFLCCWLVFAQSCLTFRTPDKKAISGFAKKGVELRSFTDRNDGNTIHYVQTGSDTMPTLLFIHGTPGSWTAFEPYLLDSSLRSRFRLISIDRPGFGYSNFGKPENLAEQSRQMGPVIQKLKNGKKFRMLGHSLGAPMALQLQLDYPGLADEIFLLAGSIDPAAEKPERWRYLAAKTPLNYLLPGAFRPSNQELIYLKSDLKKLSPRLGEINCPVYFIHGRKDSWVPPVNVDFGLKMLVGAPIRDTTWLGGGHFIPWTHFEEIREILLSIKNGE